jgi:hypothetical protein
VQRISLTERELQALLTAAGEGGEGHACFEDDSGHPDEAQSTAYDSGMRKLRALLARKAAAREAAVEEQAETGARETVTQVTDPDGGRA